MSLTLLHRAAILGEVRKFEQFYTPTERDEALFLAGLRMGRAEGREQAAKVCDAAAAQWENTEQAMSIAAESLASEIRALPEEPT